MRLNETPCWAPGVDSTRKQFTPGDRVFTPSGTAVVGTGSEGVYLGWFGNDELAAAQALVGWDTPSGVPFRETVQFDRVRQLYL